MAGGFDIAQPLVTLVPWPADEPVERVHWVDYDDEEVGNLPRAVNGCVLFYFKTALSCWECDALDKSFKDKDVVSLLNHHFINYKATDDMEDFERGLNRLGIKDAPYIIIIKFDIAKQNPIKILAHHNSVVDTNGLIGIITSTLDHCSMG